MVRIAQKMGYHRDGEMLGLDSYETEMRRRLWWQIIMQDSKYAMLSGLSQSLHPLQWDAQAPLNVNDADIFPGSTDKVQSREGPTEMAYVLMLYEMYKFKMAAEKSNDGPALEAALLGQDLSQEKDGEGNSREDAIAKFRENARELNRKMEELENRFVDSNAGPVHKAALTVRPMLTGQLVELLIPLNEQPEYGTEIFGPRDNLFKIFVVGSEQRLGQYEIMKQCGFLWFVRSFFQPDVYALISGHLCERPTGSLADRGWAVLGKIFEYHEELLDMSHRQFAVQAQITLKAWKTREQALLQAGIPLETPDFIRKFRELAPSQDSKSSGQSQPSNTPPIPNPADAQQQAAMMMRRNQMMAHHQQLQQQQQMPQQMHQQSPMQASQTGGMDPFLGGLFDVSNINWDVFGDMGGANEQVTSNMFGYPFSSGGFGNASGGGANSGGQF